MLKQRCYEEMLTHNADALSQLRSELQLYRLHAEGQPDISTNSSSIDATFGTIKHRWRAVQAPV